MDQNTILQHGGPHSVRARAFQNFVQQHGLVQQSGPVFTGQAPDSAQSSLSSIGSFNSVRWSGIMTQSMELDQPDVRDEVKALEQALAGSYEAADLQTRQHVLYQEQSFFETAAPYQVTARIITTEAEGSAATRLITEHMAMQRVDRETAERVVREHMVMESQVAGQRLAAQRTLFGDAAQK